jgi:hypothetical protein
VGPALAWIEGALISLSVLALPSPLFGSILDDRSLANPGTWAIPRGPVGFLLTYGLYLFPFPNLLYLF